PLLDHGRVYASLRPSMLAALDEQTGRVVWTKSTPSGQLAAGADRLTIVGSGRVTALTKDGRAAWSLPIHHKTPDSALVIDRQRVYVALKGRHPGPVFAPSSGGARQGLCVSGTGLGPAATLRPGLSRPDAKDRYRCNTQAMSTAQNRD